jgi:hypothetical protein
VLSLLVEVAVLWVGVERVVEMLVETGCRVCLKKITGSVLEAPQAVAAEHTPQVELLGVTVVQRAHWVREGMQVGLDRAVEAVISEAGARIGVAAEAAPATQSATTPYSLQG